MRTFLRLQPTSRKATQQTQLPDAEGNQDPEYTAEFTKAPDPFPPNCFVKHPNLLHYGDTASYIPSREFIKEARICEQIEKSPHPNIVSYLGCIIKEGRIVGLCFVRYTQTLWEYVNSSKNAWKNINVDEYCSGIEAGIEHLHSLGLVHLDINPSNVMMAFNNKPAIIDLDSCQKEGEELYEKGWGTVPWAGNRSGIAHRQYDYDGLESIRAWLRSK